MHHAICVHHNEVGYLKKMSTKVTHIPEPTPTKNRDKNIQYLTLTLENNSNEEYSPLAMQKIPTEHSNGTRTELVLLPHSPNNGLNIICPNGFEATT